MFCYCSPVIVAKSVSVNSNRKTASAMQQCSILLKGYVNLKVQNIYFKANKSQSQSLNCENVFPEMHECPYVNTSVHLLVIRTISRHSQPFDLTV